jgi:hypothetical protein
MLAVLPLIVFILLFLVLDNKESDWRNAIISSAVIWGTLLTASTELLSLFKAFTFFTVLLFWSAIAVGLSIFYYRRKKSNKSIKHTFSFLSLSKLTPVSIVLLSGIFFIVAVVGIVAVVSPPNNWDSMTYHMPRVVHWIQNRSVAHYPTYDSAQLVHPPFAEFAIMHLQILSGSDRFANLIQWASMVGSILGVSLIAKQLGSNSNGQIFAAVFCSTIPMGILQASSTQNDYVVAFWLVGLAHYVLLVLPYKKPPTLLVFAIAASLALAILSKSSAYLFGFPFMVCLFVWYVNRLRWGLWKPLAIVAVTILLFNLGHYLRNIDLYGSAIATVDYTDDYKIEVYSLPTWVSNIVRNLSLHADIVRYLHLQEFITPITGKVEKLVSIFHQFLGVDTNDPRTTFPPNSYRVPGFSLDENVAVSPLHLLLIFIALISFSLKPSLRRNKETISYLVCLVGGFLILCLMLKLQPFHVRHHLSLFVLFSSFVGLTFSDFFNRYLLAMLAIVLIVTSFPFVLANKYRPIATQQNIFNTTRDELYFTNRPFLAAPYIEAADFLKTQDCQNIGLSIGGKPTPSHLDWEYPIWSLLQARKGLSIRLQHILDPANSSSKFLQEKPYKDFNACAIFAVRNSKDKPVDRLIIKGINYTKKWEKKPITILLKQ